MASAGILIPTQLSPYPIRALEYVLTQVEEVGQFRETPLPVIGIAVSMHDRAARVFNQSMVNEINHQLSRIPGGDRVSLFSDKTWIPRLNVLSKSQDKGYPLCAADLDDKLNSQDRNSVEKATYAFESLAREFLSTVGFAVEA
jgi:cellulose biosynthesis protein BcsQ